MQLEFTTQIFREGPAFVAYTRELDLSSCGDTPDQAAANLKTAVRLFLDEAGRMGTLEQILDEAGFSRQDSRLAAPPLIATQTATVDLPEHTQA